MAKQLSNDIQDIMVDHFKNGHSASSISRLMGYGTTSVTRILKRNGCIMASGKGKEHSGWKGGRGIKSGYWTVYNVDHPRRMGINRVFEHILVAEKKYGRTIKKGEPIHHINFNRLDNNPDNLYLCSGHKEHMDLHYSLEDVARKLFNDGKLGFKDGKYYWK